MSTATPQTPGDPAQPRPHGHAHSQPNILLITSDQQHWFTLGINNPHIKTPSLDRLARRHELHPRLHQQPRLHPLARHHDHRPVPLVARLPGPSA